MSESMGNERRVFAGFVVVVENRAGSVRKWTSSHTGQSGQTLMRHDYGYIEGVAGADGDELDVYLGPAEDARFVYVVHQLAPPDYRKFEEDKVFLGFPTEKAAVDAYLVHRDDGDRAYGGMSAIPVEEFRRKLDRRSGSGKIRHEGTMAQQFDVARLGDRWVGTSQKFDIARGPDGNLRVGQWDRGMTFGRKLKDEVWTEFSVATLSQLIDNWLRRGEKLSYCYNHQTAYVRENGQPAPALAYANAVAIVAGGKVVRFERLLSSQAEPPDVAALAEKLRSTTATEDNPEPSPDGCWWYRCEHTPLGEQLLPNYAWLSPMFRPDGTDEQGNDIGYVIFDLAATNTPFQAGCLINFQSGAERRRTTMAKRFNEEFARKLGVDADDKPAVKQAYAKKLEETKMSFAAVMEEDDEEGAKMAAKHAAALEEMAKHYEDAYEDDDEDGDEKPPHVVMRKYAAKFRRMAKMGSDQDKDSTEKPGDTGQDGGSVSEKKNAGFEADEDAKMQAFTAVAKRLGINVPRGASSTVMLEAITAATVSTAEIPRMVSDQVKRELETRDRKRVEMETKDNAKRLVKAALAGGYPKAKEAALLTFASDPQTYDAAVALVEPFLQADAAQSVLFTRMTGGGAPLAVEPRAQAAAVGSKDRKVVQSKIGVAFVEDGGEFSRLAISMAEEKDTDTSREIDALLNDEERKSPGPRLYAANVVLKKRRPDLWKAAEEQYDF